MVIPTHFGLTIKEYAQAETCPGRQLALPGSCLACGSSHTLQWWGTYWRWVYTPSGDYLLQIQRVRCRACRASHSLLPDFLHAYRRYELSLLYAVVWQYLLVGLSYKQIMKQLPPSGPADSTVREWIESFSYGAGHLLLGLMLRSVMSLSPQPEIPAEKPPVRLDRSGQPHLKQAYQFWQMCQILYAQVKERQPRLHFDPKHLLHFGLYWLHSQVLPPRLFWSPRLATTPTRPFY